MSTRIIKFFVGTLFIFSINIVVEYLFISKSTLNSSSVLKYFLIAALVSGFIQTLGYYREKKQ